MSDDTLKRHAKRIRTAWDRVRQIHPDRAGLRPGRPPGTGPDARYDYDSALDEAWFQAMDGADQPFGGFELWPYERSQESCEELRRLQMKPDDPMRFLPRPVGRFPNGDLLCLATLGGSNLIGKVLRVTPEALSSKRANAPDRPCDISLAIAAIAPWISATFLPPGNG